MNTQERLQFTRYLYIKDEVELMIVSSILERNEQALFWAYELFYSGYERDLKILIWKIYYDFFAALNPSFEKYLITKFKTHDNLCDQNTSNDCCEKLVGGIIHNLLIRPHNLDVFILRQMTLQFEFDFEDNCLEKYKLTKNICDIETILYDLLNNNDYNFFAHLIMNLIDNSHLKEVYIMILNYYKIKIIYMCNLNVDKMCENFDFVGKKVDMRLIILSKVIYFAALNKKIKMGKNLFIQFEYDEIKQFHTVESILDNRTLMPYKILKTVQLEKIDSFGYLSLFSLERKNHNIRNLWYYNWLYYASFTPLWHKRLHNYNAVVDYEDKKVIFQNEDEEEMFFEKYNLEPDEQPKNIQDFIVGDIEPERRNWFLIFEKYKNKSVLDIDEYIFNDLSNVNY